MDKSVKSGERTLLLSVLMSAPGPLLLGIGLTASRSSTQLADFFRRSAELLALLCSYFVFRASHRADCDAARKAQMERRTNLFVGSVMCLSGIVMAALALFAAQEDKGNVTSGLIIAGLGMVANTLFWRKYTRLNRQAPNPILAVQARLYRVKALVDTCVTAALAAVALFPGSPLSNLLDRIGSVVVAVYMVYCGIRTIREAAR